MPKRSNAFQNLFHILYRQLAGHATVTESKMLHDNVTEEEREVDILIESEVAGHKITIGVECNAQTRKSCVEWVERMRGKHQNLPTDKLILVSQSGFYRSATKKAQFYGIDTISLGNAMKADWTKIVGKKERLFFEYYDNTAHYYVVMKCEEERLEKWAPPNDQVVLFADGAEMTINQVVNTIIASEQVYKHVFHTLDSGGEPKFSIAYRFVEGCHILDRKGSKREIAELSITLETVKEKTPVPLQHGNALGYQVSFGEGAYSKGSVSIAVLESEGQPTTNAIRLATGELQISQTIDRLDLKMIREGVTT